MLHSVIALWFSKTEGQVRPTAVLREKTVVLHARERYDWPLQRGIWRSQKVESGFSRAQCPEGRFQRLIWGMSVNSVFGKDGVFDLIETPDIPQDNWYIEDFVILE